MELRHLRYFVAVAEEGSLTVAAEKRLFTAQPSLSRQLRDLEQEVGAQLFVRGARGVERLRGARLLLDQLLGVDRPQEAGRLVLCAEVVRLHRQLAGHVEVALLELQRRLVEHLPPGDATRGRRLRRGRGHRHGGRNDGRQAGGRARRDERLGPRDRRER